MAKKKTKKKVQKQGSRNPAKLARSYTDQRTDVFLDVDGGAVDAGLLGSFHKWDGEYLMMTLMLEKVVVDPKMTGIRLAPFIREHAGESAFGYIHQIGVADEEQKKGYGSRLLEDFIDQAKEREVSVVLTAADDQLADWLGRFGFKVLLPTISPGVTLYVWKATGDKDTEKSA